MNAPIALAFLIVLSGCASLPPDAIPPEYAGPIVQLVDTAVQDSSSRGTFFAATEVDGKRIVSALTVTMRESQGRGFALQVRDYARGIPVRRLKVKLSGTHATAAPIHEIAARAAGTFFSVEGLVDFEPKADRKYVVAGTLTKEKSCVWIEDLATKEVVTERVCTK